MNISFQGKVFRWAANEAFYLVSLPAEFSAEIKEISEGLTNGFGSLKVEASIGTTVWRTSIFPDSKTGLFDLPLKAAVRKANDLEVGSTTEVQLEVLGF
ncbi:MAG: hypothetical protein RL351_417 [Actinomycetota bacterium]|jgi:hypothetical protein